MYEIYYLTVSKIIEKAVNDGGISDKDIRDIINKQAFFESSYIIENAIKTEQWQIIKNDGTTSIKNPPSIPLTLIQKRWLKAISLDPRVKLFNVSFDGLEDIEPLFTSEDYCIFDQYNDGDDFKSEIYIKNFKTILTAIKNQKSLNVVFNSKKGNTINCCVIPKYLEYSEKDNKFRLITVPNHTLNIINLNKIINCDICDFMADTIEIMPDRKLYHVKFELVDERKSLERAMLHFSHFEKQVERMSDKLYEVKIFYDKNDETEIVIRILSFGPYIKVTEPNRFVDLIKQRLKHQKRYKLTPDNTKS